MNDTVGNWLARAGYYTAFLGKHVNNCEWATEQGWSHWGGLINTVRVALRPLPAFPSCLHPTPLPATTRLLSHRRAVLGAVSLIRLPVSLSLTHRSL